MNYINIALNRIGALDLLANKVGYQATETIAVAVLGYDSDSQSGSMM